VAAGPEIVLATTFPLGGAAVTATPDGFAVVAAPGPEVRLWRLDPAGTPVGPSEVITTTSGIPDAPFPVAQSPAVAYGPDGLVVAWAEDHLGALTVFAVVRTTGNTHLLLSPQIHPAGDPQPAEPAVAVDGTGKILVAWNETPGRGEAGSVRAQVFGRGGTFLAEAVYVDAEVASDLEVSAPDAAGLADGFLVAWESMDSLFPGSVWHDVWLRRVDASGAIGPTLNAGDASAISRPALTIDEQERFTVGWQAGAAPSELEGPTCFSQGLYAVSSSFASGGLLLQGGRFEARIVWTDHAGHTGSARGVPLTNDSGYFWFFAENNVEVMVKVLDGRAVNGHFWVFYGSLSDVAYQLIVTDTVTGRERTYRNPAGQLASAADTLAFPAAASSSAASAASAASVVTAPQPSHVPPNTGAGPCAPPETVTRRPGLCLGERFEVEVAWHANETEGVGRGVRLTGDSGYLWFFGANNIELVVKVLDGRAVNGHFWVFYGALTDVRYAVLVRDTLTGIERIYRNAPGQLRSLADTAAF
jgi:hypothetical protein